MEISRIVGKTIHSDIGVERYAQLLKVWKECFPMRPEGTSIIELRINNGKYF